MTAGDFRFVRHGRSPRTAAILAAVYAAIGAAILWLDAAPWLMALLALPTLPALWDLWTNPEAGIVLGDRSLRWYSGRRHADLDLGEIDHMRFDTRWDLSVRVTAVLRSGRKLRLPYESLPPHKVFEAALSDRGVTVKRQHFTVF